MIAVICLLRDADPRLMDDVAARLRPGDQVILVDDSGTPGALTRIRAQDWPPGVAVTPIVTGTPAPGDGGIATNLGLDAVTAPHVLVLEGATRLTGPLPRPSDAPPDAHPEATLICGPDPVMAQTLFPATALRRAEGVARSDIGFLWALRQRFGVTRTADRRAVTRARPGPALLDAVQALLDHDPAAADWLRAGLPHWLADPAPGARLILQTRPIPLQQSLKPPAPPRIGAARLTVALHGPHARRTPLAYPHLAPLWADHLRFVTGPADLAVHGHPHDVITRHRRPVLLSEEPLWDALWSPDPLADVITLPTGRVAQRNHHTSAIFAHHRIPTFLLTDPRYIRAYQGLFARNAALTPAAWRDRFAARARDAVFMAEWRDTADYDFTFPEGDVAGLCRWRTRLALATPGRVLRQGAGWPGSGTRFDLTDWHGDKLRQLDHHARLVSGIENTHQPAYLSEKIFDAFAVGARPLYVASPAHRVHDLGLPPGAWINLHGLAPDQAAQALPAAEDDAFLADYALAQRLLRDLFTDDAVAAERARLRDAVVGDLQRLADDDRF